MRRIAPVIRNAWFWIGVLIVMLAAFILFTIGIYQRVYPHQTPAVQLWNYFQSSIFQVLVGSALLPLLVLLVQGLFNIKGAVQERIQREKEVRRGKRLECLRLTAEMWNQLYELASQVRHYRRSRYDDGGIHHILEKIANFPSSAEDVVNMWHFRLGLSEEDQRWFLVFVNALLRATETVAYAIQESANQEESADLQDCLGVIQEGIGTIAHQPIIIVLTHSMELLELKADRQSSPKRRCSQRIIDGQLRKLKKWGKELKEREVRFNSILPGIEGLEVEAFRTATDEVLAWTAVHPGEDLLGHCRELGDFVAKFWNIPPEKLIYAWKTAYSKKFVKWLAEWLVFESTCQHLLEMAGWQRRIGKSAVPLNSR